MLLIMLNLFLTQNLAKMNNTHEPKTLSLKRIFIRLFILFLLVALVMSLFACGSRKVDNHKEETQSEKTGVSNVKINKDSVSIKEYKKNDFSLSIKPKNEPNECETKTIIVTDKDGNKSEIPYMLNSEVNLGSKSESDKQIFQLKNEIAKKDSIIESINNKVNIKNVEAEKPMFWSYAIVGLVFFILGFVVKYKIA